MPATLLLKTVTHASQKYPLHRTIYPELLPPAEDVKKVERRLAKENPKAKIDKKK